ncbi:LysR family transcriptional regulator [Marinobacterium arenosum]|uniref:LysR family transcriptional regulator n=1 Tax=Marinobacterium arenosum TaxID=2862496 RepID=UPI001C95B17B|nr:LysR family transcriptional regulator [Marinobacterium arenosum]MBY4675424.1 LysR family transcriptional regulator [Marinobacterium arenosum]
MASKLQPLLNRLSFRQLQVFTAVHRLNSYSKAAEELGLTQPAVSAQVRQLESALGEPLFEYIGKRLYRTQAGDALALATRNIFSELERLQMEIAELAGQVRGELRLAAVSTAQYVVPRLLKGFLDLHPQINVRMRVVNRAQALDRLAANTDDLVIMGMVPQDRSLTFMPFLDNEMVAVVPADHRLLDEATPDVKAFLDGGLILREPGSGTRLALEAYCAEQRLRLPDCMELGSNAAVLHAVLAGLGVAVLPRLSCQNELAQGRVRVLPLDGFPLRRSWCTVYPKGKHPTPVMNAFLGYIQENIALFGKMFAQP